MGYATLKYEADLDIVGTLHLFEEEIHTLSDILNTALNTNVSKPESDTILVLSTLVNFLKTQLPAGDSNNG